MDATHSKKDDNEVSHYYCEHHAPQGAIELGGVKKEGSVKKFLPIIAIFSFIFLFTIITSILHGSFSATFSMRMMMGSFFAVFGLFKVFNLRAFADAYADYDILAKRSRAYALIYPFIEIILAVLYLSDIGGIYRDIFTFALMVVSSIGVIQKIRLKEEVPCACLGMVFKVPMTSVTLIEDTVMALEAFIMILMNLGRPIAYLDTTNILVETLKVHNTAEWVEYSVFGHKVIGLFLLVIIISGILERFNFSARKVVSKYLVPIILFFLGLMLTVFGVLHHMFNETERQALWYLFTHWSQFLQHFLGGSLFLVAGMAEYIRYRKDIPSLAYVTPIIIFLTGSIFFFHQQLGIVPSVIFSMNWHMLFGSFLIVGGVIKIIDLLLREENKGVLAAWIVLLLVGAVMMATYQEPKGAYELLSLKI